MKHYRINANGDKVLCYGLDTEYSSQVPWLSYRNTCDEVEQLLYKLRKEYIQEREKALKFVKINEDRELKKYYSKEAKVLLKKYRAVCLAIPFFCSNIPGDCPYIYWTEWSVDLEEELDEIGRLIELEFWKINDIKVKTIVKEKETDSSRQVVYDSKA